MLVSPDPPQIAEEATTLTKAGAGELFAAVWGLCGDCVGAYG